MRSIPTNELITDYSRTQLNPTHPSSGARSVGHSSSARQPQRRLASSRRRISSPRRNCSSTSLNFRVAEDAFTMSAVSSPADYRDQLRLYATKLAFPRWDAAPLARTVTALNLSYDPVPTSAGEALDRNVGWLLRDREARMAPPVPADAQELTLEKFRAIWEPRLATGPIEIQLFGFRRGIESVGIHVKQTGFVPASIHVHEDKRRARDRIQGPPSLGDSLHKGRLARSEVAFQGDHIARL